MNLPRDADPPAWRDLLWLAPLAAAYRLGFWLAMPRVLDTADAIHYAEAALRIAGQMPGPLDPKIPLLYPALAALLLPLVSDVELACRIVSFAASLLTLPPLYLLARRLHGTAAARIAAIAFALWPWLADYACAVGLETLGVLCLVSGIYGLMRALDGAPAWRVAAPAAFAALNFTRPEGAFLMLFAIAAIAIAPARAPRDRRIAAALLAAAAAAALALSAALNRLIAGAPAPNYRAAYIVAEFDHLRFADTAMKTLFEVFPIMLGPALGLFLGIGLLVNAGPPRKPRAEAFVLAFAAAQWALSLFVLSPAPRYLMTPLLLLAIWSARGIVIAASQVPDRPRLRPLRALPAAALIAAMLAGTAVTLLAEHAGRTPRQPREYKAAGEWMRESLEPGLIFTRKPQIAFYARMPSTGPAEHDSLDEALARARAAGARYIVADERYAPPGLRPLLDPALAPPELELLHTEDAIPGARVLIYRDAASPAAPAP